MKVKAILAVNKVGVIGWSSGEIPWMGEHPEDLKRFKQLTEDQIVVMGRKTWESLPSKPLPNRINVVISSKPFMTEQVPDLQFKTFEEAYRILSVTDMDRDIWIIGGAKLLKGTLSFIEEMEITEVNNEYVGDVVMPEFENDFRIKHVQDSEDPDLKFVTYERI